MNKTLMFQAASAALVTLGFATAASAQLLTPAEFKALCEAPGNTVNVVNTLKIQSPVMPPPLVTVNSGCQVVFAPDSNFEADNVNMRFAGVVAFQASAKASVLFKSTSWNVAALTANLSGNEGGFFADESRLTARTGDITVGLGAFGTLGITGPINGMGNALNAAGALTVSAGEKFTGTFETTRLRAGTGMAFSLAGPEAVFAANNTSFVAAAGQFALSSSGAKAQVDLNSGAITAPGGIALTLPGAESKASLLSTRATALAGSVTLQAGSAGRGFGVLSVDQAIVRAGGAYTMTASIGADKGEAVLSNTRVTAGADILIQSDRVGLTNVLNNTMTSPTGIRAFTGASGACIAEGNLATAPVVAICQ